MSELNEKKSNNINLLVIKNRVAILVDKPEEKTEHGLYIPDPKPQNKGVLVGRGEECTSTLKIGDKVLFRENVGDNVEYDNKKYLFMYEDAVYGKIPE